MKENKDKIMTEEEIIKRFKILSTISMVMGLITAAFATQILLSGWSIWPAIVVGLPTIILNGVAKTYQEMLKNANKTDYGDPTAK